MPRVTMGLTKDDVDNANHIFASTPARTKAQAVSLALALTRFIVEERRKGSTLLLEKDGDARRIVMPDLERVTAPNEEKLRQAARTVAG